MLVVRRTEPAASHVEVAISDARRTLLTTGVRLGYRICGQTDRNI